MTLSKKERLLDLLSDKEQWVFVATKNDGYGDVVFFSKVFSDHRNLKIFSAQHSSENKTVEGYGSSYFKLSEVPVMIGDVLEKMDWPATSMNVLSYQMCELVNLWHYLDIDRHQTYKDGNLVSRPKIGGLDKSLNEILSGDMDKFTGGGQCSLKNESCPDQAFKDPQVQKLYEFLLEVFKDELK